jgi:hypothetical protein
LGGNVYRLTDTKRERIAIYFIFAKEFGWTREQVNKHPTSHLKDLLAIIKEDKDNERQEMDRQSRRKSF